MSEATATSPDKERPVTKIMHLIKEYEAIRPFPEPNKLDWIETCRHYIMQNTGGRFDPKFIKKLLKIEYPECN